MKNYINFYFDNEGKFTAEIHKDGKYKRIKQEKNILKLLEIAQDYGYNIQSEGTLTRYAQDITKDFDKYMRRKQRLKVLGNITISHTFSRLLSFFINSRSFSLNSSFFSIYLSHKKR